MERGAVVTAILTVIAGIAGYQQLSNTAAARMWVLHTHEVLNALESTKTELLTAELFADKIVSGGIGHHEARFQKSKVRAKRIPLQLLQSTEDNPEQRTAAMLLNKLTSKYVGKLESAVKSKDRAALAKLNASEDFEEITQLLDDMTDRENQLMAKRTESLQQNSKNSFIWIFCIAAMAAFLQVLFSQVISWWIRSQRRTQAQLAATLNSMSEGLYQIDTQGCLVYMNPKAESLLGYNCGEILGQQMHDLIHNKNPDGSHRPRETCPLVEVIASGNTHHETDDIFVRKDGTIIPVEFASAPLRELDTVSGAVICFSDISDRKAVEKRMSEFYSIVSHELRTPMTSIKAALGLLEGGIGGQLTAKGKNLVSIGRQEADRLVRLINDILDMKKIETGKLELQLSSIDSEKLIESTIQSMSSAAQGQGLTLLSQPAEGCHVTADYDRIVQVLTNLVSNAMKFSPEGSAVLIRVLNENGFARFEVQDRGPGIPANKIKLLFGMFQQLDSTDARAKGGTGLGLAISKSIVDAHGGAIGVESTVGEGSVFWFTLPLAADTTKPASTKEVKFDVLIVEDEIAFSKVLAETVEGAGRSASIASTLAEARANLSNNLPNLVLLDLNLPDGDGMSLLGEMRANPALEHVPVIVITGRSGGADLSYPSIIDWMEKPFDPARLTAAIQRASTFVASRKNLILVVDDDESTRQLIQQQLEQLSFNCISAKHGGEAVQLAQAHHPDLIILDVVMPEFSGFDAVAALRNDPKLKDIPLIVYTAKDLTEAEQRDLVLGLTSCLIKSKTTDEVFLDTVKSFLSIARDNQDNSNVGPSANPKPSSSATPSQRSSQVQANE